MDQSAVFYHIGGVMMDDEEKRRHWENDPPGWYFWSGVHDGNRRLHGPYESQEQAGEEVELFYGGKAYTLPIGADSPAGSGIVQRIFSLFSAR